MNFFFAKYSPCLALVTDPVHHAAQLRLNSLLPHVSIVIMILVTILLRITIVTNAPGLGSRHFEWQPHQQRGQFGLNVASGTEYLHYLIKRFFTGLHGLDTYPNFDLYSDLYIKFMSSS